MIVVAAIVGAGFLASCSGSPTISTKTKFSEAAYGVKASPRVASGKRIPEGGGRSMVGKPYRVKGKTYVPRHDPDYSATGLASWYGPNFHGRKTANGEVYDMNDLSAAHPTLPLPSYVRVTNLSNQRSVVVRVNDRGPFAHGRIIDVSANAAALLDFKSRGVAKVKVDYVGPARMDGRDQRTLMASYDGPNTKAKRRTMFASRKAPPTAKPITVASVRAKQPMAIAPAAMPAAFDDPIGPLILQSDFITSYAETPRFTKAHAAAADLAATRTLSTAATTVQLGVFADAANAERIGSHFNRFGPISVVETVRDGRRLQVVRVTVSSPGATPETVIAAADQVGLSGAFVVSR